MAMLRVDINRQAFERLRDLGDLLKVTDGDLRGPVLTRVAQLHRKQEAAIFASEGAEGGAGGWPPLSPEYAKQKQRALTGGRKARAAQRKATKEAGVFGLLGSGFAARRTPPLSMKVLIWSGEMRDRFLRPSNRNYHEDMVAEGRMRVLRFGARSSIASYHREGSATLPVRDMILKTPRQVSALLRAIVDWYRTERVPQFLRARRALVGPATRLRRG